MEFYSAIKKERNNAICSNMDGPRDYHTRWNNLARKRQIPCDITYIWNLKYDTNEHIHETETGSQIWRTDLWLPRGMGGAGMDWESGIRRCRLLYTEWISNKVLLYSAGNDTSSNLYSNPVTNHKIWKGNIYISESLCRTAEINTIL